MRVNRPPRSSSFLRQRCYSRLRLPRIGKKSFLLRRAGTLVPAAEKVACCKPMLLCVCMCVRGGGYRKQPSASRSRSYHRETETLPSEFNSFTFTCFGLGKTGGRTGTVNPNRKQPQYRFAARYPISGNLRSWEEMDYILNTRKMLTSRSHPQSEVNAILFRTSYRGGQHPQDHMHVCSLRHRYSESLPVPTEQHSHPPPFCGCCVTSGCMFQRGAVRITLTGARRAQQ